MDFSRPISRRGRVGFVALSLSLAAMTFAGTIWGIELPSGLSIADDAKAKVTSIVVPTPVRATGLEEVLEPKVTARLPIFGGVTPVER